MITLSLIATAIALTVAAWSVGGVLERFVLQGLDRRLDGEIALLASAVDANGRIDIGRIREQEALTEAGPGWAWRITGPHGVLQSEPLPDLHSAPRPLPAPPPGPAGPGPAGPHPRDDRIQALDGADRDGGAVHARQFRFTTRDGPVTIIAAAPRAVLERPIRGAITPLLLALATVAGLLVLTGLAQLRFGLRPLRRLRDEVAAIRRGECEQLSSDQPEELRPLADELNALTDDNRRALSTARLSAANLAHALKTPIAALSLELKDEAARAQVARLDAIIRHHLARARAAPAKARAATPIAPVIDDLCATIRGLHRDQDIIVDAEVAGDLTVAVDRQDLTEILGNLIDNAARHARRRVRIMVAADPADARWVQVSIEDDGPGIPAEARYRIVERGARLDESKDGYGFGLSISAELAAIHGGRLQLDEGSLGGLLVELRLPRIQP